MSTAYATNLSPREAMIESQLRVSRVTDERVIAAMRATPRERFVPAGKAALAYSDTDVEIIPGRALLPPLTLGRLLASAQIGEQDRVLIVGASTGYSAALAARLAGQVVALECDEGLAGIARANLSGLAHVQVVTGPLEAGHAAGGPYEVILLDGGVSRVPDALAGQLADEGLMVGVIFDQGVGRGFTARRSAGVLGLLPVMDAAAPMLPGFAQKPGFVF